MKSSSILMVFILGLVLGMVVGVPLSLYGVSNAVNNLVASASAVVVLVLLIATLVLIAFLFRNKINKVLFGGASARLENSVEAVYETAKASIKGDEQQAAEQLKTVSDELIAWYAWSRFYRWSTTTAIGLLVAFGGFAGTILLVKQNEILGEQLTKISDQTALFEKQTNSINEQTSNLARQNELLDIQNQLFRSQLQDTRKSNNNQLLAGRITELLTEVNRLEGEPSLSLLANVQSLATSLEPTDSMDYAGEAIDVSRERGVLLSTLLFAGFQFQLTGENQLNFSYSKFDNTSFNEARLGNIILSHSDLRRVDFKNSDVSEANLAGSLLPTADKFANANMWRTNFEGAIVPNQEWLSDLARLSTDSIRGIKSKLEFNFENWSIKPDNQSQGFKLESTGKAIALDPESAELLSSLPGITVLSQVDMAKLAKISVNTNDQVGIVGLQYGEYPPAFIDPGIPRNVARGQIARFLCRFKQEAFKSFYDNGGNLEGAVLAKREDCAFGDMPGQGLKNAVLLDADFNEANLDQVDFGGATLPYPVSFTGASLKNANFNGAFVPSKNFLIALESIPNPPAAFNAQAWVINVVGKPRIVKNASGDDTLLIYYVICNEISEENEAIDCRPSSS